MDHGLLQAPAVKSIFRFKCYGGSALVYIYTRDGPLLPTNKNEYAYTYSPTSSTTLIRLSQSLTQPVTHAEKWMAVGIRGSEANVGQSMRCARVWRRVGWH